MRWLSKSAPRMAAAYLLLVLLALGIGYFFPGEPGDGPSYFYFGLLTLPWSIALVSSRR